MPEFVSSYVVIPKRGKGVMIGHVVSGVTIAQVPEAGTVNAYSKEERRQRSISLQGCHGLARLVGQSALSIWIELGLFFSFGLCTV